MNKRNIEAVEVEMKRLAERIIVLKMIHGDKANYGGSRDTAAIRRASMDLTRALSRLRGN